MKIECIKCKNNIEVNWKLEAYKLKEVKILFNCDKCEHPHKLRIYFGDGKVEKTKVYDDKMDYVG